MQEPTAEQTRDESWVEVRFDRLTGTNTPPADSHTLKQLSLVLAARGIPFEQSPSARPRQLLVPARDRLAAEHELRRYLQENRPRPSVPERFNFHNDNTLHTLSVLILIGIFHNLTQLSLAAFGHNPIDWLQLGSADNELIRAGEWWRTITALTLHADGQHLLGNLLIGGYFVVRLCRLLGGGLGWNLILWSGIIGNTMNALVHSAGHRSVGASTALFGAIGIAGMVGLVRRRQIRSKYWILPVAAAIGLLAMLGTGSAGSATDIGAHLFGFACGMILGAVAGGSITRHGLPSAGLNRILAAAAMLTPIGAWLLALTA